MYEYKVPDGVAVSIDKDGILIHFYEYAVSFLFKDKQSLAENIYILDKVDNTFSKIEKLRFCLQVFKDLLKQIEDK